MTDLLVQSLRKSFDTALGQLQTALEDCPETLWETDLWPDEAPTQPFQGEGLRGSAPWILAHHALVCLDYDLCGELARWVPPSPIADFLWYVDPTRVFTQPEMLGYLSHCRRRVAAVLDGLDEELAATPVPQPHRYAGTRYGVLLGDIPLHVVEHAAQIRQFLRTSRS